MKKVLALLLAMVLVLSLAACGGGSSNSGEIEITLENYSKYLEIFDSVHTSGYPDMEIGGRGIRTKTGSHVHSLHDTLGFYVSVSGKSQNFNYNDIKVTGRLKGSYGTYKSIVGEIVEGEEVFNGSETFDKEIKVECDITGKAEYSEEGKTPDKTYTHDEEIESEFEVTSISGTVTPA